MLQKWLVTTNAQDVIQIDGTPYNEPIDVICAGNPDFGYEQCPKTGDCYFISYAMTATAFDAEFSNDGVIGGVLDTTIC